MRKTLILSIIVWCTALSVNAAAADSWPAASSADNINVLAFTPGHTQTITFPIYSELIYDFRDFHACMVFTAGAGRLTVRVGPSSAAGEYSGYIYATVGMIGSQPIFDYAYDAQTLSFSADVPQASAAVVFTAVIASYGSPEFPLIMSMVVSHQ